MYEHNSFITLTYDDKHLPPDYSVHKKTFQTFIRALRDSTSNKKIRYFACGEYGDENLRPHYHALLFNHSFKDQLFFKNSKSREKIYTSTTLNKIWSYGNSYIGTCTYRSAAYIARYVIKKIGGDLADEHYTRIHPLSGNLVRVNPEFALQSRRPGLGHAWLQKFKGDIYPSDFIVVDEKRHPVPRFYTRKLLEEEQERIKRARKRQSIKPEKKADQTEARLRVREQVATAQLTRFKREV